MHLKFSIIIRAMLFKSTNYAKTILSICFVFSPFSMAVSWATKGMHRSDHSVRCNSNGACYHLSHWGGEGFFITCIGFGFVCLFCLLKLCAQFSRALLEGYPPQWYRAGNEEGGYGCLHTHPTPHPHNQITLRRSVRRYWEFSFPKIKLVWKNERQGR